MVCGKNVSGNANVADSAYCANEVERKKAPDQPNSVEALVAVSEEIIEKKVRGHGNNGGNRLGGSKSGRYR